MGTAISVRLDKETLKELTSIEKTWRTDRSESVRRLLAEAIKSWKTQKTLERLKEHKISIGKAAEECNISVWEILDFVKEKDIDWAGYSREDLEKDLKALEGRS